MNGCPEFPMSEDALDASLIILIESGKVKKIPLTQQKHALVDAEDYEWLMQWKWCALKPNASTFYAKRNIRIGGKTVTLWMHREILGLCKGDCTIVDHKNHNGLHNWKKNLRVTSKSINAINSRKRRDNVSGYRGVCWASRDKRWISQITIQGVHTGLGYFKDKIEAAKAYDAAAYKHRGREAVLNFPLRRME